MKALVLAGQQGEPVGQLFIFDLEFAVGKVNEQTKILRGVILKICGRRPLFPQ
jgi:hypothetical protein